jgi:hypothetical protein
MHKAVTRVREIHSAVGFTRQNTQGRIHSAEYTRQWSGNAQGSHKSEGNTRQWEYTRQWNYTMQWECTRQSLEKGTHKFNTRLE